MDPYSYKRAKAAEKYAPDDKKIDQENQNKDKDERDVPNESESE